MKHSKNEEVDCKKFFAPQDIDFWVCRLPFQFQFTFFLFFFSLLALIRFVVFFFFLSDNKKRERIKKGRYFSKKKKCEVLPIVQDSLLKKIDSKESPWFFAPFLIQQLILSFFFIFYFFVSVQHISNFESKRPMIKVCDPQTLFSHYLWNGWLACLSFVELMTNEKTSNAREDKFPPTHQPKQKTKKPINHASTNFTPFFLLLLFPFVIIITNHIFLFLKKASCFIFFFRFWLF